MFVCFIIFNSNKICIFYEARLEAMMFSNPTDCNNINGTCLFHSTCHMLQIFSLKLASIPVEHGPVELYGYIATRDPLDCLLNYVINFSRDDPIIIEQVHIYTSLIQWISLIISDPIIRAGDRLT